MGIYYDYYDLGFLVGFFGWEVLFVDFFGLLGLFRPNTLNYFSHRDGDRLEIIHKVFPSKCE